MSTERGGMKTNEGEAGLRQIYKVISVVADILEFTSRPTKTCSLHVN